MSENTGVPAGRRVVLEPTPPGFWPTVLGVIIAALAPLFGFLAGSMMGAPSEQHVFGPMYVALYVGVMIGAVGVVLALVGGRRLYLHHQRRQPPEAD